MDVNANQWIAGGCFIIKSELICSIIPFCGIGKFWKRFSKDFCDNFHNKQLLVLEQLEIGKLPSVTLLLNLCWNFVHYIVVQLCIKTVYQMYGTLQFVVMELNFKDFCSFLVKKVTFVVLELIANWKSITKMLLI